MPERPVRVNVECSGLSPQTLSLESQAPMNLVVRRARRAGRLEANSVAHSVQRILAIRSPICRLPSAIGYWLMPDVRCSTLDVRCWMLGAGCSVPPQTTPGGGSYPPYAFTEHGALMAATVLNSPRAVAMSLYIIRAFVKMREDLRFSACQHVSVSAFPLHPRPPHVGCSGRSILMNLSRFIKPL